MNYFNFILGILLIILGILFIYEYTSLVKKRKHSGLTINIAVSGYGLTIVGIVLILRELC